MSGLRKIDEKQIKEAIAARYHVAPAENVCLYHDYEFVRRGGDKVRREFFYGIIDERCKKPVTKADSIRAMSDEEMAAMFAPLTCPYNIFDEAIECEAENKSCEECWLDWLKKEAGE